jgi:hypothetical protein
MLLWATIVSLLVAVSVQGQERVVDLTPKSDSDGWTARQSYGREQVDCRGRSTGRIGPAPTLSLTIARLDSSELSMGGQFVADIRVTNTGTEPVILPTVLPTSSEMVSLAGRMRCRLHLAFQLLTRKARSTTSPGLCCAARPAGPGLSNPLGPVKA